MIRIGDLYIDEKELELFTKRDNVSKEELISIVEYYMNENSKLENKVNTCKSELIQLSANIMNTLTQV